MKLPPDVEFHEDIRLLIYRPHGSMNEEAVNKLVSVIGDLEAKSQEPFNRFLDTLGHDEVELNFRYRTSHFSSSASLLRGASTG